MVATSGRLLAYDATREVVAVGDQTDGHRLAVVQAGQCPLEHGCGRRASAGHSNSIAARDNGPMGQRIPDFRGLREWRHGTASLFMCVKASLSFGIGREIRSVESTVLCRWIE